MTNGASPFLLGHGRPASPLAGRAASNGSIVRSLSQLDGGTARRRHRAHGSIAVRRLIAATATSSLGDGLVVVAFPLLALRLTSSPLLVSGVAAATRLPWLVIGLPAGAVVDRVDRKRLVAVVDLLRATVVALVALAVGLGRAQLAMLYGAAFLLGAGETLVHSAARSVIPLAAADESLARANAQYNAARVATVQFGGPALGGLLFGALRALPFAGDAISYVGSAGLLRSALAQAEQTPKGKARAAARPAAATRLRADLADGLATFGRSAPLRSLAAAISSFAFCQAIVLGILVVYGSRVLHLSPAGYGLFLALGAVGDLLGSAAAPRVHGRLGAYATLVAAAFAAAGGYLLLSAAGDRLVAVVGLAVEAVATSVGNVASTTARFRLIPAERFGVVNNAYRMVVLGVGPVGALLGGALATSIGLRPTMAAAGIVQVAALAAVALPLRSIRAAPTPEPALEA